MEALVDKSYRAFRFILESVIGYGAVATMFLATMLAIVEVVRRYVFGVVFVWGQDAVTYGLVGAIFLYVATIQANRSHLRVSVGMEALGKIGFKRVVLVARALITAVNLVICGMIALWGIPAVSRSMMMERKTQSMVIEIWPFQLLLVIGLALTALVCLFQLYQDVWAVFGKRVFEWAPNEEGLDL